MTRRRKATLAAAAVAFAGIAALVACAVADAGPGAVPARPVALPGGGSEHRYGKGPLILVVGLSSKRINVAQDVKLTIATRSKAGWRVSFPAIGATLGRFTVAGRSSSRSRFTRGGYTLRERSYVLQPFLPGSYDVPSLTVTAEEGKSTITLNSDRLAVIVESLIPKGTKSPLMLRRAVSPVGLPDAFPEIFAGAAILIAALSATLIFFIGGAARRRRERHGGVPPWVRALRELDRLVELDLPTKGRHREFYHKISHLVRRYVEEMFGINAPEQTTEEFLFAVRDSTLLGRHRRVLGEFLSHCDLVKFASYLPAQDEVHRAVRSCRAFIDSSSSDLKDRTGGGSQQR